MASKYDKTKSDALDVYDACHKKVKQHGKTKDTWKNCVGTAAMPLLTLSMGPMAPVGRQAVEFVAGTLYDVGNALGLSNAEEEARLHAEQAAAWKSYETAWFKITELQNAYDSKGRLVRIGAGNEALTKAVKAAAKMRADNGLPPRQFFFFSPQPSSKAFYKSIGIVPGHSSPDAKAIVTYAWRGHAQKFFADYALWFDKLDDAVSREAADVAITKAAQDGKRPTSPVVKVVAFSGVATAAWWLWKTFK